MMRWHELWIFLLLGAALVIVIPQCIYRFNNPDMSETQLFLHFFDAYRL